MRNPIRIFYSTLSDRFYASAHYQEWKGAVVITGEKFDVTNQIAALIEQHQITFSAAPATTETRDVI